MIDPQQAPPAAHNEELETKEATPNDENVSKLSNLCLAALGVVFGDIGTSPIYALRQAFYGVAPIHIDLVNVLGVLSLIFWALIIVISIKYLIVILRLDNEGEGGILVLLALLRPWRNTSFTGRKILITLGIFGAALLYSDGMITPAISVLSAVEGIGVALPSLKPFVIPITLAILILLFLFQKKGTTRVGMIFGPIILLWFIVLAFLGVMNIQHQPQVLTAVNPVYALNFFLANGWKGFLILGAVFLAVTGGEVLFADMGHFGRLPIRINWFFLVLPALLLNYFGQGALILAHPNQITDPFYQMAPRWGIYPLVILATFATVIASQAVISGSFSLTQQAVQFGESPLLRIIQTSPENIGQIYVPGINWMLMTATIALVLTFRSSTNLADAYGVAITLTMVITTVLGFFVMRGRFQWSLLTASVVFGFFLIADLAFVGSNLSKIEQGGWIPLLVAGMIYILMSTWRKGKTILDYKLRESNVSLEKFLVHIEQDHPLRVSGTAIFMAGRNMGTPPIMLHHLEHNQVLHEHVILLTIITNDVPRVPAAERLTINQLKHGLYQVFAYYGFMQTPNVPVLLRECGRFGLKIDVDKTTFYIGWENLVSSKETSTLSFWRKFLFAFMARNASRPTAYYGIPPERVVEIGLRVEL